MGDGEVHGHGCIKDLIGKGKWVDQSIGSECIERVLITRQL